MNEQVPIKIARKPYTPTAEERLQHEATHCPYRSWCEHCVAGVGPDSRHEHMKHADGLPHIEFDYAAGSGKASDPESQITLLTASESHHGRGLCDPDQAEGSWRRVCCASVFKLGQQLGSPNDGVEV